MSSGEYRGGDELGSREPGRARQQRYESTERGRLTARLRKRRQRARERGEMKGKDRPEPRK